MFRNISNKLPVNGLLVLTLDIAAPELVIVGIWIRRACRRDSKAIAACATAETSRPPWLPYGWILAAYPACEGEQTFIRKAHKVTSAQGTQGLCV